MQTTFSEARRADPQIAMAESILRKCVHCGFCTATCPTFVLLGDERDSPRGRIYLIKDMLENDRPATRQDVTHIDRCLSCLSCTTTCPSGVDYMHLVDHARVHIEKTYRRPVMDRMLRNILTLVLPWPARFRASLFGAFYGRPLAPFMAHIPGLRQVAAMLALSPVRLPPRSNSEGPGAFPPPAARRGRVALLSGCAQPVLAPEINDATIRILNRVGIEVVLAEGEGCCGALVHHMGREEDALATARRNVDAWMREIDGEGLDAILITASGCGTTVKDYGHMLARDPAYAEKAERVASLARDVSEYLEKTDLGTPVSPTGLRVAYHSACSMQHGQKITRTPKILLSHAGFEVHDIPEGHLCCGSAGTYNIMQPEIATRLRDRKIANIEKVAPDVIAAGNIGCITQLAAGTNIPIVHTVELLDWAYGGPRPEKLDRLGSVD
ncbi:MAG: glycolate oxidase subunit GlcF [Hyphomicrobiales bacterium]|nr:glycolate oxidase subunit GlcF [Hyphomicrobiales bacterium]